MQAPLGSTAYDLSQLTFIQTLLTSVIEENLVEPYREALSLDYDMRVEEVRVCASCVCVCLSVRACV